MSWMGMAAAAAQDAPVPNPDQPGASEAAGIFVFLLVAALAVLCIAALAYAAGWRKRIRGVGAASRRERLAELDREANELLIRMDEAVHDAAQEVGFASAEFGDTGDGGRVARQLRSAVSTARDRLREAFELRQRLDDSEPEPPELREAMLQQIIQATREADEVLGRAWAELTHTRDEQRSVPESLDAVEQQIDAARRRIPAAREALEHAGEHAARTARTVRGNVVEAGKRLDAANREVRAGRLAVDAGNRGEAVRRLRTAQAALAQADELLDAVMRMDERVRRAQVELSRLLTDAEDDLNAARAAAPRGADPAAIARRDQQLAEAAAVLRQAQAEAVGERPDVLEAYRLAAEADARAEAVLAEVREAGERRAMAHRVALKAIQAAVTSHGVAQEYIGARRYGVGREARTRLLEAERQLDRAEELLDDDPDAALRTARQADRTAQEALALAEADFAGYDRGGLPYGGGYRGVSLPLPIPLPIPLPLPSGGGGGGWDGTQWGVIDNDTWSASA